MKFKAFLTESRKESKLEVDYRRGSANRHCGICTMFRNGNECTAVKGSIEKQDVCDLFKRKS